MCASSSSGCAGVAGVAGLTCPPPQSSSTSGGHCTEAAGTDQRVRSASEGAGERGPTLFSSPDLDG
uniref:Transient receptor potential cation channel, subfamily M, member 4 n=1 Tax=Mus musculus TaxID=10090 RepID=A0A1B0GSM7_MOUSE